MIKVCTESSVISQKSLSQIPSDLCLSPSTVHMKKKSIFLVSSGPKPLLKVVDHTTRLMYSFKICDYILQIRSQQCSVVLLCLSLGSVWNSRQFLPVSLPSLNLPLLPPFKYILIVDNLTSFFFNK